MPGKGDRHEQAAGRACEGKADARESALLALKQAVIGLRAEVLGVGGRRAPAAPHAASGRGAPPAQAAGSRSAAGRSRPRRGWSPPEIRSTTIRETLREVNSKPPRNATISATAATSQIKCGAPIIRAGIVLEAEPATWREFAEPICVGTCAASAGAEGAQERCRRRPEPARARRRRPGSWWPGRRGCGSGSTAPRRPASAIRPRPPRRKPVSIPSRTKGTRTNQLVAPTSFMTSISRRREKIESRIVFAISTTAAIPSRPISAPRNTSTHLVTVSTLSAMSLP